jgi:ubiquinol oxidase
MEALGGDQLWQDRFLAQHAAIAYYWVLVGMWLVSPSLSYKFSELIEAHAVDTYGEFVDANRDLLAELPAPRVTRQYYKGDDLFLFDEFQTSRPRGSRRPPCETLLDVFTNIRDDEAEHVETMVACQDPNAAVNAPKVEATLVTAAVFGAAVAGLVGGDISDVITGATDATDMINDAISGDTLLETGVAGVAAAAAVAEKAMGESSAEDIANAIENVAEGGATPEGVADLAAISSMASRMLKDVRENGEFVVKDSLKALLEKLMK